MNTTWIIVIGAIGVLFGRLIQAVLSRQRECLAEAFSVQFTRKPAGLSGALQKIGGASSRITSPHAGEASHMFFGNGLANPVLSAFATHPPLDERIRGVLLTPALGAGLMAVSTVVVAIKARLLRLKP